MRTLILHTVVLALLALSQAVTLAAEGAKPARVTYDEHVLPIFRDQCIACHNQDKARGGLTLNNYAKAMEGGSSGQVIKPGDPAGSRLFLLITHQQEPFMPPKTPPIAAESIETVRQWIQGGALENAGSTARAPQPQTEISLKSVVRGKPEGPPPLPEKPLSLEPVVASARGNAVTALAINPWSPLLAVAGQKQVLLYHAESLALLGVLPFPEGVAHVLKFSRNGSLLLAGGGHEGKSGRVVVWNVRTGERVLAVGDETDAVLAADISPDQTQIALGGPSKVIRVFSTRDGQMLREIRKHTDWIYALEYSPDGVLLASGDRNGGLFVWESYTGREYFSLRGHTAAITAVSWREDSNALASASEDGSVRLWEMENGNPLRNWGAHPGGTAWVQYAHDGRLVTCGRDRVVRVWDGNGGQQRAFEALPDVALRCAFSHDGTRVVAGDWTGQVHLWAAADGKPLGSVASNPPSLAQQAEEAKKELAARQAAQQQLAATAAASQTAAQQAAAELAAAQQAVGTTAAAAKAAAEALPKAKEAADRANAALPAAQSAAAAKGVLAKAFGEATAKVKAAADQAKEDKELAAALARSQAVTDQATAELATAQKALADLTAAAQGATAQLAAAQKAAADTAAAAAAAPKVVEMRTPLAKAAADKAAADQAAANQAAAAVTAAQERVNKLTVAPPAPNPTPK